MNKTFDLFRKNLEIKCEFDEIVRNIMMKTQVSFIQTFLMIKIIIWKGLNKSLN